jgi:phospholipid transport system substrate-binding protein
MRLNGIRVFVALVTISMAAPQVLAATPSEFIAEAVEVLSAKLDGRRSELADDSAALYALIDEVLLPRFDRKTAAQQVLARNWRPASEEQRARFIDAFYSVLVQRYADGVLDFEPDRIKVLPFRGDAEKRIVTVKTTVDLEDGTNISVNYALMNHETGWMMFDVIIEGVSYIRNFRTEFDAEIKATDLEQVIVRLEAEAGGRESEPAEAVGDDGE